MAGSLAGCGDQEKEVRATIDAVRSAFLAEDYRKVCRLLTPAAQHQIGSIGHRAPTTCPYDLSQRISAAFPSRRDRIEPTVQSVSVDDDRAVVIATLAGDTPTRLRLVRREGTWKLASVFGTSGPPREIIPPPPRGAD